MILYYDLFFINELFCYLVSILDILNGNVKITSNSVSSSTQLWSTMEAHSTTAIYASPSPLTSNMINILIIVVLLLAIILLVLVLRFVYYIKNKYFPGGSLPCVRKNFNIKKNVAEEVLEELVQPQALINLEPGKKNFYNMISNIFKNFKIFLIYIV